MEHSHDHSEGVFTRERMITLSLLIATGVAIYLCWLIISPFLPALTWAVALAVMGRPLHRWLLARIRYHSLAAAITLVVVSLLLTVPTVFVTYRLVSEATENVERLQELQEQVEPGRLARLAERHPGAGSLVNWLNRNINVPQEIERGLAEFGRGLPQMLNQSIWVLVQLLVMLLLLFFFFRDEYKAYQALLYYLPLSRAEAREILHRIDDTIHATIYGTVVVAFVQGGLGGLMFWLLGLPSPILWGLVMALLAVVPYLGAFVVWGPAALILALEGSWEKALLLTAWGTIVVGLIDNLLYPILVGQRLRQHTLVEFFAIVGGLLVFGAAGLVLGPIIVTVTLALIDVWRRRTTGHRAAEESLNDEQDLLYPPPNQVRGAK